MESFKQRLVDLFDKNTELIKLGQLVGQQPKKVWLVGGCLRDLLLSRPVTDIDISTENDPTDIARQWSSSCNGRWFWLDEERLQSRVLLPSQLTVDFAPLRASTIGGDQALRDFTVNSLALPFGTEFACSPLLDPLNGLHDLEQRTLRFCSEQSIADDPLRMLKGVRHAVTLRMRFCSEAEHQIKKEAPAIRCVAAERIRDELGRILLSETPSLGFEMLHRIGLLQELFGAPCQGWNAESTFADLADLNSRIRGCAGEEHDEPVIEENYSTKVLFLLATFLRHYQPAQLADLLHVHLRLSRPHQRIVICLQQELSSRWLNMVTRVVSARQKALLVEELGHFPEEQLVYWSIYRQILRQEEVCDLLEAYQGNQRMGKVPDLLSGHQVECVIRQAGKEVGCWLKKIKQAELTGEVHDAESALDWLKSKLSD